jgi:hypothetical protein
MSNLTQTENGAIALKSSGSCIVDYFMMYTRTLPKDSNHKYLEECWNKDPIQTVAIIFNGRDRINGKKEKKVSNEAMLWLRRNKPETYKANIMNYVNKYGCWKDLLYIAYHFKKREVFSKTFELELFANKLREDQRLLSDNNPVSLCAKWAPSENDRNDTRRHFAHKIASILYGKEDSKKMEKYRKKFLVPLRKKIKIVETFMCENKWGEIVYENVPGVASKKYLKAFNKHDKERYEKFLEDVRSGKKEIKVTGILPHELLKFYIDNPEGPNETIELQWRTIVENVKSAGCLKSALAMIDISGSMFSASNGDIPARCAISLGILTSLCCEGQFHKKVMSFSEKPTIVTLRGDSLYDCWKEVQKIPMGYNTNFIACTKTILDLANMFNVPDEQLPKKLIALTDMQFDAVTDNPYDLKTTYEYIVQMYKDNGYTPAKFIFWNLNSDHCESFPVSCDVEGTALVSGFSEQLLKIFMNYDEFDSNLIVQEILLPYIKDIIICEDEK